MLSLLIISQAFVILERQKSALAGLLSKLYSLEALTFGFKRINPEKMSIASKTWEIYE